MKNTRLTIILLIAGTLLLIPFVAMQFTNEVNWSPRDFVIMGILLFGTSILLEFTLRFFRTTNQRIAAALGVIFLFLIVWAEIAVGVFGSPLAGS